MKANEFREFIHKQVTKQIENQKIMYASVILQQERNKLKKEVSRLKAKLKKCQQK